MQCRECHEPLDEPKDRQKARFMAKICRDCKNRQRRLVTQLRKDAPPPTGICDCCGTLSKLVLDHDHMNNKFRGWLCNSCNCGIGMLGDDVAGLIRALSYLNGSSASSNLASERLPDPDGIAQTSSQSRYRSDESAGEGLSVDESLKSSSSSEAGALQSPREISGDAPE